MKFREIVEAYERKFNPSNTMQGQKIAHRELAAKMRSLMEEKKLVADRVNFRQLWEDTVASQELEENLVSSAFPTIAGEIISSVIIEAYKAFPMLGLSLVKVVPSKVKVSQIPGWKAIGKIRQLNEREDYKQIIPPNEKVNTVRNYKYGGLLDLTKEDIFFDQTGELMNQARDVGREAARHQDEIIMKKVADIDSNALSDAALYSGSLTTGNKNLSASTALSMDNWEAIDQALTARTDDGPDAKPIDIFGEKPKMMVAPKLKFTAWRLRNNDHGDLHSGNVDANPAKDAFDTVINRYMSNQTTNTDWYYGWFNKQFRWEEVWPIETYSRVGQDTEKGFNADVIQQFKCSFYGGCGATATEYVIKCTA